MLLLLPYCITLSRCTYRSTLMLFRASLMSPIFVDADVDTTCIASLS
jgi:hypothetical protein